VIALPLRTPFSHLSRALGAVIEVLRTPDRPVPPYDPVFLPAFPKLTPDQAQEMRYRRGRDR
jgi:hypothetical protein